MALPKEPRQKMINLMYLVLTALLALNVSSEILNAFKTVKSSLDNSSVLAGSKTAQLFQSFQKKMEKPETKEKATIWFGKAQEAQKKSEEIFKYIDELKMELMKEAGYNPPKDTTFKEDNLEAATRLFVEEAPKGKGKGKELLKRLEDYKKGLLSIDSSIQLEIGNALPIDLSMPKTQSAGNNTWEAAYFRMTPTIAALTILSKFQNDVRNAEAQVVEHCHKKIGEVELVYDEFKAIANASASYVMPNDEVIINAGVGAFSSTAKPSVTIDGASATMLPDGSFEQKFNAPSAAGEYTKKVRISFVKPDGTTATVEKDIKYTVGQPAGLTVSTDKTRYFYAGGVENELSVTGSGGSEQITLDVQGAGITKEAKGKGLFVIKCSQPGVATVTVTDAKSKAKQTLNIPIKPIPDPIPQVDGKRGGDMAADRFKITQGVAARMKDFVFGDYKWTVASFRIYFTGTGFDENGGQDVEVNGNLFNAEVKRLMSKCGAGTTVVIDQIKLVDVIGNRRPLEESLTFVLN